MTTKTYLAAKAKFTKTGRSPEEFDLLALADATGATGFTIEDGTRLGHSRQEIRDCVNSMIERELLYSMGGRNLITAQGEARVKEFFPGSKADEHFENAMGTISKLIDSESGADFRNANNFLQKVQSETGKRYDS